MKKDHSDLAKDFAFFQEDVPASPAHLAETPPAPAWKKRIHRDLVRSPSQMAGLYLGLSAVGYIASLAICAQNTLGLSGLSHVIAQGLHALPDPWCPILCGSVFTGIPFFLSCIFLSRFQHRYLIFKMWWFFAFIPLAATGFMLLLPHGLQHARLDHALTPLASRPDLLSDGAWMAIWAASAIVLPYVLEGVVYLFVRPKTFREAA